jgi:hypothetical protein
MHNVIAFASSPPVTGTYHTHQTASVGIKTDELLASEWKLGCVDVENCVPDLSSLGVW